MFTVFAGIICIELNLQNLPDPNKPLAVLLLVTLLLVLLLITFLFLTPTRFHLLSIPLIKYRH